MGLKHNEDYYRNLQNLQGYVWGGWLGDEQLHFFVKERPATTVKISATESIIKPRMYSAIKCRDSEVTDGSLAVLIRLGKTR